eukprot:scaffold115661_cov69-Phaeocystis_antarctica.AAC.4
MRGGARTQPQQGLAALRGAAAVGAAWTGARRARGVADGRGHRRGAKGAAASLARLGGDRKRALGAAARAPRAADGARLQRLSRTRAVGAAIAILP